MFRCIASLPRDDDGFISYRKLLHLCAKAGLSINSLDDLDVLDFVFYIEGKLEAERQYFEYMTTAVYSATAQIFSKKAFQNPFEKKEEEPIKEKRVASKEGQQETFAELQKYFGINLTTEDDT